MSQQERIILPVGQILQGGVVLDGELPASVFDIDDSERMSCVVPLEYQLCANISGEGILVSGCLRTILECSCDRCLGNYQHEIIVSDVCHFYEGVEEREIDLTEDIREDIVVNFPVKCLCDNDCKGLCSQCGQNLNAGGCECSDEPDEPSVWDKLDGLDL